MSVEPHMVEASRRAGRLVLFAAASGRTMRRTLIMGMQPVDPAERATAQQVVAQEAAARGLYWEYLQADDSPLLVRADDMATAEDAHDDAARLFAQSAELRVVYVRDLGTGRLAWWLTLDGAAVVVPARTWPVTQRHEVVRDVKRALAVMAAMPPWGVYRPL